MSKSEVFHEYYNILNEEQVSALFTAVHWKILINWEV